MDTHQPVNTFFGEIKIEWTRKPGSVYAHYGRRRSFNWTDSCLPAPGAAPKRPTRISNASGRRSILFGLAGGGACPADVVANEAVRSYRTISPLPEAIKPLRRYIFCGAFPGIAPDGR